MLLVSAVQQSESAKCIHISPYHLPPSLLHWVVLPDPLLLPLPLSLPLPPPPPPLASALCQAEGGFLGMAHLVSFLQQLANKNQSNLSTGRETQAGTWNRLDTQWSLTLCRLGPAHHLYFRGLPGRAALVLSVYKLLTFNFVSVLLRTKIRTISQFKYDVAWNLSNLAIVSKVWKDEVFEGFSKINAWM